MSADTTLTCRDCAQAFTFTSGAQDFYASLAFKPAYVRPRYYPDGESAVVMLRELET